MSIAQICDNCGVAAEIKTLGYVKKLDYCDECLIPAGEYLDRFNVIHTRWVEGFSADVDSLRAEYPNMALPDV